MIRVPQLPVPPPVRPERLRAALSLLPQASSPRSPTADRLQEAMLLVRRRLAGAPLAATPTRLVTALVHMLGSATLSAPRAAILELVLAAPGLGWRRLWALWEVCPEHASAIVPRLADALWARTSSSDAVASRLPRWLDTSSPETVAAYLLEPHLAALHDCETRGVPLLALPHELQVIEATPRGQEILRFIVEHASKEWWSLCAPGDVYAWAEIRHKDVAAAVVDRELVAAGDGAHGPPDLAARPGARALVAFALRALGDPTLRSGQWAMVSDRGKTVFEWLLVAQEFAKILEEFRRHADDDRARYWARRFKWISDARFAKADDTAICLMRIGPLLVIEFGSVGNACYVYHAPEPPLLRRLVLPSRPMAAQFKSRTFLAFGTHRFRFLQKLSHRGGWTSRFDEALASHART